jgi:hypothetical protein
MKPTAQNLRRLQPLNIQAKTECAHLEKVSVVCGNFVLRVDAFLPLAFEHLHAFRDFQVYTDVFMCMYMYACICIDRTHVYATLKVHKCTR